MIYSLRGKLISKEIGLAVIECGGVGYACRTTAKTLSEIGAVGGECFVYTYMNVREDGIDLFGFADNRELGCFKLLLSVSGVGPKVALAILSDIDPNTFALTVAKGDHKRLSKVKGVGPKIAQRIVLELKDKLAKEYSGGGISAGDDFVDSSAFGGSAGEAVEALCVLGYSADEAERAVRKLDLTLSTEELIRLALKSMAKF